MATLKYIIFSLFVLFVTCITAEPLNTKLFEPESKIVDDFAKAVSNCLSIADSTTESRSSKLKKIALPLLLALKLKSSIIIPIVLKALAFLSVKALISGTLALILSSVTFFRDFFGKKRERITTAYITAPGPVQAELVEGWNRNGIVDPHAQDLAYGGQFGAPQNEYLNAYPNQF